MCHRCLRYGRSSRPSGLQTSCTENFLDTLQSPAYCGALIDPEGVFSSCLSYAPVNGYYDACLADACTASTGSWSRLIRAAACNIAESLNVECGYHGEVDNSNWRQQLQCCKYLSKCNYLQTY